MTLEQVTEDESQFIVTDKESLYQTILIAYFNIGAEYEHTNQIDQSI